MILVNGGTGFIGSQVVRKIASTGKGVRVMSRDPGLKRNLFEGTGVEVVRGSVRDPRSLERAMEGVRSVVNCVQFEGYPVERTKKGLTYEEIDGAGTVNQVNAALHMGVKEFIYVSGAGVGMGRTETWFKAKEIAESKIRASGLRFVIFRPTWVFGPGDRSANRFVSFAKRLPLVPLIGDGSQRVQPLYVEDLAALITYALDGEGTWNRIFDAGGPDVFTMRDLVKKILGLLGKSKPVVPLPVSFMKAAAVIMKYLPGSTISPEVVDFSLQEAIVDNASLLAAIPLRLTSFEEGLSRYIH